MLNYFKKSSRFLMVIAAFIAITFSSLSIALSKEAAHSPQVLHQAVELVQKACAAGKDAVVVFDLDDTLFSPSMRSRQLFIKYAESHTVPAGFKAKAEALTEQSVCYDVADTLKAMGINDKQLAKAIQDYCYREGEKSEYFKYDVPNPGAVEYVKAMRLNGARICYLTGRHKNPSEPGTIEAIKNAGFPYGDTESVLLLKDAQTSTVNFKREELKKLMKEAAVIACFDNEPGNVNMMKETLGKDGLVVFLDTRHSPGAKPVTPGIPWVKNFNLAK